MGPELDYNQISIQGIEIKFGQLIAVNSNQSSHVFDVKN